jgi:crossover junction endodeoxyribonuclease RuvC
VFELLQAVISRLKPNEAAIEEVFVSKNGSSTMKLCMARGVVMLAPAMAGVETFEYSANCIKKSVTGSGHAEKSRVRAMVGHILPQFRVVSNDAEPRANALVTADTQAVPQIAERINGRNIEMLVRSHTELMALADTSSHESTNLLQFGTSTMAKQIGISPSIKEKDEDFSCGMVRHNENAEAASSSGRSDCSDALAAAICHAHHRTMTSRLANHLTKAG